MPRRETQVEWLDDGTVRVTAPYFSPAVFKYEPQRALMAVFGASMVIFFGISRGSSTASPGSGAFATVMYSLLAVFLLLVAWMSFRGTLVTTVDGNGITIDWWLGGRKLITEGHVPWKTVDAMRVAGKDRESGVGFVRKGTMGAFGYGLGAETAAKVVAVAETMRLAALAAAGPQPN